MTRPPMISIYGLIDPRTGCLRYIGSSIDPESRLKSHIYTGKTSMHAVKPNPLTSWVSELLKQGFAPGLVILEVVPEPDASAAESRWIGAYRASTPNLCNTRDQVYRPPTRAMARPDDRRFLWSRDREKEAIQPAELIEFRRLYGLSQAQLAKLIGVHYSTISLWENGKRKISHSTSLVLRSLWASLREESPLP